MYANNHSPGIPNEIYVEWCTLECIVHYPLVVHSESGDSIVSIEHSNFFESDEKHPSSRSP
jgi:hypothetical protein